MPEGLAGPYMEAPGPSVAASDRTRSSATAATCSMEMAPSSSPRAARRLAEFAFDPRPTDRTTIDALYSVYDILQRGYQIAPSGIFMDSSKQFLIGLEPSPPPNHIWQEYAGYSIYSAEQDPSLWSQHSNDCTQISIASSPAYVRAEWQADAGRLGDERGHGLGGSSWGATHHPLEPPRSAASHLSQ